MVSLANKIGREMAVNVRSRQLSVHIVEVNENIVGWKMFGFNLNMNCILKS